MAEVNRYTPEEAAKITGIKADDIVRVARDFFKLGGVCDDGWYSSRCGNDCEAYALITLLNAFAGNFDRVGGFVVTSGGGFKGPGVSMGKGPQGQKWTLPDTKRLDRVFYPEVLARSRRSSTPFTPANPIRFAPSSSRVRRCSTAKRTPPVSPKRSSARPRGRAGHLPARSDRLRGLRASVDLLPRMGRIRGRQVGAQRQRSAQLRGSAAPEGERIPPRNLAVLRNPPPRLPERAAERLGYDHEMSYDEFRAWQKGMMEAAWKKFIDSKNAAKPGRGRPHRPRKWPEQGWSQTAAKKYGQYPFKKPSARRRARSKS